MRVKIKRASIAAGVKSWQADSLNAKSGKHLQPTALTHLVSCDVIIWMKRCCLSLGIFFLLTFVSRADLLEYSYSGSANYLGAAQSYVRSFSGVMIYDTTTSNITFVSWRSDKGYDVSTSTNFHYTTVTGPTSTCTLVTHSSSGTDTNDLYHLNNYMIKGVNRNLKIAIGKTYSFPAVLGGNNNRSISVDSEGNQRLKTWAETMTFAAARTQADNNNQLQVDEVVTRLTTSLENRGFHPR